MDDYDELCMTVDHMNEIINEPDGYYTVPIHQVLEEEKVEMAKRFEILHNIMDALSKTIQKRMQK